MSVGTALAAGRAAAEALMLDEFTALVYTDTTDADDLEVKDWEPQGDPVPGKFPSKVNGQPQNTRMVNVGGVDRPVIEGGLHLPWSASPEPGMRYRCTAVGPDTHPSALNRTVHVVEAPISSDMTAWRLDVVEV